MARSSMKPWILLLLMTQVVSALIAIGTAIFIFKIGVAAVGSIILFTAYFKQLMKVLDVWVVILAFVCSMIGDYFLSHMSGDNSMFIVGISLYLSAHVGYLIFSLLNGTINWKVTTLITMGFLIFYYLTLYPNILDKTLAFTVLFYLIVSCVSLGAAMGIRATHNIKTPYFIGIAFILFSDIIISFKEFMSFDSLNILILPTYYLAQISITIAVYNKSKNYVKTS